MNELSIQQVAKVTVCSRRFDTFDVTRMIVTNEDGAEFEISLYSNDGPVKFEVQDDQAG